MSVAGLIRVAIAVLVLVGAGYAFREFRKTKQAAELPVATAHKGEFLVLIRCRGQLQAHHSEQLAAPLDVTDLQIVWLAPAGGEVKKGQPLIKFDPSRTQQEIKDRTSTLEQALSTLEQAIAQSRITEDQDRLDLSTWKYTVERAKLEASKQAIMSKIQGEESQIDLGVAQQRFRVQEAAVVTHKRAYDSRISALERARDNARRLLDLANAHLALMELKSPLDGIVNYLPNYSQGSLNAQPFKIGDHVAAGQILAEIPQMSTLELDSKVEEVDRGRIAPGTKALVRVDAFPERVVAGRISGITPLTEQSFNEWPPSRSFRAYIALDSPDARMRPGMNAGADLIERRIPDAVSILAKALFTINGRSAVYVKAAGQYVPTFVEVAARNPDEVAVRGISGGAVVALAEPPKESK